jgi:hypothetical protein
MWARLVPHLTWVGLVLSSISPSLPQTKPATDPLPDFPSQETLHYGIEWRLIYAGTGRLTLEPKASADKPVWQSKLHLESAGLVSKLYKVDDNYDVGMEDLFCAVSTSLDAIERSRHRETKVSYDRAVGKAQYVERDLVKNTVLKTAEIEISPCTSDIIGALYKLRTLKLEPGQSTQLPISDGKKSVSARIEAQHREQLKVKAGTFSTIRHEAFVFNGILYTRKAQLLIWLSDDPRRLPVQIRVRMSFPIGSITLELEKEEHS